MRSVIKCLSTLLALSAFACATTGNYNKKVASWMGNDVNALMVSWGPPSNEYVMPDMRKMYTWLWVGGTQVFANYNQYLNMVTAGSVTYWCKTTFTVDSAGRVVNYRWEGNACRSN